MKTEILTCRVSKKRKTQLEIIAKNRNIPISELLRELINNNEPKKNNENKKRFTARIFLKKDDFNLLEKIKKETNQTGDKIINNLIRKNLSKKSRLTDTELEKIQNLSFEIKKIGTNINTIARFCNEQTILSKFKFPFEKKTELEPLLKEYQVLQREINNILLKLY